MIELDGTLVTDDMVFAVCLCLNGFHPEMALRGKGVVWSLNEDEHDEDMDGFISDYLKGRQLVEPKRFAREWGAMRKDVYKMMGISGKAPGAAVKRERSV